MYLNNKQLAARNQVHNPSRAGENLLKFCIQARKTLCAKLAKPSIQDEPAFEAFIMRKNEIKNMDYNELRSALLA
jgi:hypothetical protein